MKFIKCELCIANKQIYMYIKNSTTNKINLNLNGILYLYIKLTKTDNFLYY